MNNSLSADDTDCQSPCSSKDGGDSGGGGDQLANIIAKHEHFLQHDLTDVEVKTMLCEAVVDRDGVRSEIEEYQKLKVTIQDLKNRFCNSETVTDSDPPPMSEENSRHCKELKTHVELGQQFFANAIVSDPSKMFVHLGFGIFAELPLTAADAFCDKRIRVLKQKLDVRNKNVEAIEHRLKTLQLGGVPSPRLAEGHIIAL